METKKILTKDWSKVDPREIESYLKKGGYLALQKCLRKSPREIIEEVKKSGLRGRGGGGFLTGQKWEIAVENKSREKVFVCNLDESEPGTFKDRLLAENNPHQLLEGIIIGAYAVEAKQAYIYLNGNFSVATELLEKAIEQADEKKIIGMSVMGSSFDLEVKIFVGAGAYICGEESALINSIEGKRGEPRRRPPFVCSCGLFGKPTVVNNAETISNIPWIIKRGAEEYLKTGMKDMTGTKLFCVDGAVKVPGIYEAPLGISVEELILEYAGGFLNKDNFWFAQIGGSAGRLVTIGMIDEIPGYGKNYKIPLGSGAVLVFEKTQNMKELLLSWARFFERESCGQCVPCREGTFRLRAILERLETDSFNKNDRDDLEKIIWTLDNTTFCSLGKFSVIAIKDVIKYKLYKPLVAQKDAIEN